MPNHSDAPTSSIWPLIALITSVFAGLISILVITLNPFQLNIDIHDNNLWSDILDASIFSSPIFTPKHVSSNQDYESRARQILRETPLIDGHNDFPYLLRSQLRNRIDQYDFTQLKLQCHTDMAKMREGMMGGQFWSVWVPCPGDIDIEQLNHGTNPETQDFNKPNWAVRDTLEQIDITKRFVAAYPDRLQFCTVPACLRAAHKAGKIASMIGIEGGHQVGNSLGALRLMFESGARYMTLTHNCDNVFATAWTTVDNDNSTNPKDSREVDSGLTPFGKELIQEMNRLGMLIDLAHVSVNTMRDALELSRAPVIFSHSGAYTVQNHGRNVPDDVLLKLKENGGVVMVPSVTHFLNMETPQEANVEDVVDHIIHIASVAGWEHVGIGSDFDGTLDVAKGLEDTSQFPNLIARVLERGATDEQAKMLVGENLLRAWDSAEKYAKNLAGSGEKPRDAYWEDREWETDFDDLVPRLFG